jgi:hypothetical protein
MGSSVRLGRIAGIEFGVNWSWLVVFALIVWTLASAIFPSTNPGLSKATHVAMAIVAAFLFFLSPSCTSSDTPSRLGARGSRPTGSRSGSSAA